MREYSYEELIEAIIGVIKINDLLQEDEIQLRDDILSIIHFAGFEIRKKE